MVNEQGAQVLTLKGQPINWKKPPKPTDMVMWSKKDMYGEKIIGSLRTIAHIDRLDALAQHRFNSSLVVIQPCFHKGVAASAGTHDYDCCLDVYIPNVSWYASQRFLRANGFACWYRHPPLFGNHIHGFTLAPHEGHVWSDDWRVAGFTVGEYVDGGYSLYGHQVTSSQMDDYINHAFGLANQHTPGSDHTFFPPQVVKTIFDLDAYIARRAA